MTRKNTRLLGAGRALVDSAKAWVQLHQVECGCSKSNPCPAVTELAQSIGSVIDQTPGLALVARGEGGSR